MHEADGPSTPTVGMTLLLLAGAAGFMAILFALYRLLDVNIPAFGLLFLLYWAAILKQDLSAFLPSLLGGLMGISLGWMLVVVPSLVGDWGLTFSLVTVAAVLFCFMRGHLVFIINNATMLFLTVATIPQIDVARNAPMMAVSLSIGAGYMGGTALVVNMIGKIRKRRRLGAAG